MKHYCKAAEGCSGAIGVLQNVERSSAISLSAGFAVAIHRLVSTLSTAVSIQQVRLVGRYGRSRCRVLAYGDFNGAGAASHIVPGSSMAGMPASYKRSRMGAADAARYQSALRVGRGSVRKRIALNPSCDAGGLRGSGKSQQAAPAWNQAQEARHATRCGARAQVALIRRSAGLTFSLRDNLQGGRL